MVAHTGTAEYGHYYSFIDSARSEENLTSPMTETWLEFNDSRVREFQVKNLENECFGGQSNDSDDSNSFSGLGWFKNRDNSKNAYILVYERIQKTPISLIFQTQEEKEIILQELHIASSEEEVETVDAETVDTATSSSSAAAAALTVEVDYYSLKRNLPPQLFKEVWIDNHKCMFEKHIQSKSFFDFLQEITKCVDVPNASESDYEKDYAKFSDETR